MCFTVLQQKQHSDLHPPAMRMTALSAGSRTSPDADLERLTRWCLAKFQGRVSPGKVEEHSSLLLSSDADLSRRRGREATDISCNKFSNRVRLFGIHVFYMYLQPMFRQHSSPSASHHHVERIMFFTPLHFQILGELMPRHTEAIVAVRCGLQCADSAHPRMKYLRKNKAVLFHLKPNQSPFKRALLLIITVCKTYAIKKSLICHKLMQKHCFCTYYCSSYAYKTHNKYVLFLLQEMLLHNIMILHIIT